MKAVIRDRESLTNYAAPTIKVSYAQFADFAKFGSTPKPPKIARDLPSNFAEADEELAVELKQHSHYRSRWTT